MKNLMLVLCLIFVRTLNAEASKPNYSSQQNLRVESYASTITNSDQDRCQAEANYMASNNITSHVWGTIGNFEGIGYGSSRYCNTCVPRTNMVLTGDAAAQGRNGKWYRVRSWR